MPPSKVHSCLRPTNLNPPPHKSCKCFLPSGHRSLKRAGADSMRTTLTRQAFNSELHHDPHFPHYPQFQRGKCLSKPEHNLPPRSKQASLRARGSSIRHYPQIGISPRQRLREQSLVLQRDIEGGRTGLAVDRPLRIELDIRKCVVATQCIGQISVHLKSVQIQPIVEGGQRCSGPRSSLQLKREKPSRFPQPRIPFRLT